MQGLCEKAQIRELGYTDVLGGLSPRQRGSRENNHTSVLRKPTAWVGVGGGKSKGVQSNAGLEEGVQPTLRKGDQGGLPAGRDV